MSKNINSEKRISYLALGLTIGLTLDGIVGLIIDNMIILRWRRTSAWIGCRLRIG